MLQLESGGKQGKIFKIDQDVTNKALKRLERRTKDKESYERRLSGNFS